MGDSTIDNTSTMFGNNIHRGKFSWLQYDTFWCLTLWVCREFYGSKENKDEIAKLVWHSFTIFLVRIMMFR